MQTISVKLTSLVVFACLLGIAQAGAPATIPVKKKAFGVIVDFAGLVCPEKAADVVLWPQGSLTATVESVVPHGTQVAKGDSLIVFDTRSIKTSIKKQEAAIRQAELGLKQAQDALAHFQKSKAYRLEIAAHELKIAEENLKRFSEAIGPSRQRIAKFEVQQLDQYLLYAEEELKQLEKMYTEDKVTEESEEIVLTRQRNLVNRIKFVIKENGINTEQTLRFDIPRMKQTLMEQLEKVKIETAKLKIDLPTELKSKQVAVEQKQIMLKSSQDLLAEHKHNLSVLTVKAPVAGVVYYGYFRNGKWSIEDAKRSLRKGGTVRGGAVVMSIVPAHGIIIKATVNEVQSGLLKPGQTAQIRPKHLPNVRLTGNVVSVSERPTAPGKHAVSLSIDLPADRTLPLYAGAACQIRTVPYKNDNALVLPKNKVYEDKLHDSQRYVWLLPKGAKTGVKRIVTVGYTNGDEIEITSGLNTGDRILKEVPKDK